MYLPEVCSFSVAIEQPVPMPAIGTTRGGVRGFWGRVGGFGRGGGIALRGPAVGLTSGGTIERVPPTQTATNS